MLELLCKACAFLPCTPKHVNETKVMMGRCWRHPWISGILVIGIIIGNAMIIKGSADAAAGIGNVINQIGGLAQDGIGTVDSVQGDLDTVHTTLSNYTKVAIAVSTELQLVTNDVKVKTLAMIEQAVYDGALTQFQILATKLDQTAQLIFNTGKQITQKILDEFKATDAVMWMSEKLKMMKDLLSEIQRYEEIVIALGDVAGDLVNKARGPIDCRSQKEKSHTGSRILQFAASLIRILPWPSWP